MGLFAKLFGSQSKVAAAMDKLDAQADAFVVGATENVKKAAAVLEAAAETAVDKVKEEVEDAVDYVEAKVKKAKAPAANSAVSEGKPANTGPTSSES